MTVILNRSLSNYISDNAHCGYLEDNLTSLYKRRIYENYDKSVAVNEVRNIREHVMHGLKMSRATLRIRGDPP